MTAFVGNEAVTLTNCAVAYINSNQDDLVFPLPKASIATSAMLLNYDELTMNYFQNARPVAMDIAAASVLAPSEFLSDATADEPEFMRSDDIDMPPIETMAQIDAGVTNDKDTTVSGK